MVTKKNLADIFNEIHVESANCFYAKQREDKSVYTHGEWLQHLLQFVEERADKILERVNADENP